LTDYHALRPFAAAVISAADVRLNEIDCARA
jgi:hypothetical protein